jgi:hypothetical protein
VLAAHLKSCTVSSHVTGCSLSYSPYFSCPMHTRSLYAHQRARRASHTHARTHIHTHTHTATHLERYRRRGVAGHAACRAPAGSVSGASSQEHAATTTSTLRLPAAAREREREREREDPAGGSIFHSFQEPRGVRFVPHVGAVLVPGKGGHGPAEGTPCSAAPC